MTFEIQMNGTTLCTNTDMNGIIDPQVQKEVNTAGSLSFTVLPTCTRWSEFKRMRCYLDVLVNGYNIFRGRVMSISDDIYNQRTIECEGALAFLMDSAMPPIDIDRYYDDESAANHQTPAERIDTWLQDYHNYLMGSSYKEFSVGTSQFTKLGVTKNNEDEWKFSCQPMGDFLADICTKKNYGIIRAKVVNGANLLDWLDADYAAIVDNDFVFGDNIIEVTNSTGEIEPYSMLLPLYDGELPYINPFPGSNPYYLVVGNVEAEELFGNIIKIITLEAETGDASHAIDAIEKCNKIFELQNPIFPSSITIKGLDRYIIEKTSGPPLDVGDWAPITIPHQNLDKYAMMCLSETLNLCHPENNEYSFGTYVSDNEDYKIDTLTKSFAKSKKKKKK